MQVSNVEQGSEEWHQIRLGKATASRFKDVLAKGQGISRNKYKAQLIAQRLSGKKSKGFTSWQMAQGTEREAEARLIYEAFTGNKVSEVGFVELDHIQAGASPDGLVNDDGTIEIKCTEELAHYEVMEKQKVPAEYVKQIQGQLWVTERQWCDFISYCPEFDPKNRMQIVRVHRDEGLIAELQREVPLFMQEVMEAVDKWQ